MSTDDSPDKPREDDSQATANWHRARAKGSRKGGYTKMAEQQEQIAEMIERKRGRSSRLCQLSGFSSATNPLPETGIDASDPWCRAPTDRERVTEVAAFGKNVH